VEPLGDQFLACPALTDHEHWTVKRSGAAGAFNTVEKGPRLANEIRTALHILIVSIFYQLFARKNEWMLMLSFSKPQISGIFKNWHGLCKAYDKPVSDPIGLTD
jgi:hypothetical protein